VVQAVLVVVLVYTRLLVAVMLGEEEGIRMVRGEGWMLMLLHSAQQDQGVSSGLEKMGLNKAMLGRDPAEVVLSNEWDRGNWDGCIID
jgi:hypothetical protein